LAVELVEPARNLEAGVNAKAKVDIEADLAHLGRWYEDVIPQAHAPRGALAGSLLLQTSAQGGSVAADLSVRDLAVGPAAAPTWKEPLLHLKGSGSYDRARDLLLIEETRLESAVGEGIVQGQITHFSSECALGVNGTLHYDLEKLQPYLRPYLGKDLKLAGKDTRAFRLEGPLAGASSPWSRLKGDAGLSWTSAEAHGARFGPAEIKAHLEGGWLRFQPVVCTINSGQFNVQPNVRLEPAPVEIQLAPGTLIDHAQITPAMCAGALGYAAPALAGVAEADGIISVKVDGCRLPLTDPQQADVSGQITIHAARLGTSPLIRELGVLLKRPTQAKLSKESPIRFKVAKGRVYHEKMELVFPDLTVRTSGSVGFDGTLALNAEMPIPPKWAGGTTLGAALAKQTIRLPIIGTLDHPRLDPAALRVAAEQFTRDLAKEMIRQKLKNLLKPR
jgi:hypothetical protein